MVVWQTDTDVVFIKFGVFSAVVTIAVFWTVAHLIHALQVTVASEVGAIVLIPVFITNALITTTRNVFVCVFNAFEAMTGVWPNTAITNWMTGRLIVSTVVSIPKLLTLTVPVRVLGCICNAFKAVAGIRSITTITYGVTVSGEVGAVIKDPSILTHTVAIGIALGMIVALKTLLGAWASASIAAVTFRITSSKIQLD